MPDEGGAERPPGEHRRGQEQRGEDDGGGERGRDRALPREREARHREREAAEDADEAGGKRAAPERTEYAATAP